MLSFIIRRIVYSIPVFIGAATIVFVAIRLVPGDIIIAKMEGEFSASPEQLAQARADLGIDKPIYEQYVIWIGEILRGDLGESMNTYRPVTENLLEALPVTAELAIIGMFFSILIAIPAGVISALFRDRPQDHLLRIMAIMAISIPSFVIGTMILLLPAIWWDYYPPLGYPEIWVDPVANLKIMIPAALAIGAIQAGQSVRMMRTMTLEVMSSEYVRVARAKGLKGSAIVIRHVLRNALIPVVTLWGASFAGLLGGTVVVEQIFSLPGVGQLTLQAIQLRDYTQLQGNVLFFAGVLVLFNLIVDLSYAALDPRIRYS